MKWPASVVVKYFVALDREISQPVVCFVKLQQQQ